MNKEQRDTVDRVMEQAQRQIWVTWQRCLNRSRTR
jgi:hypothetical protein